MNRTIRMITGVLLVLVITFSAIIVFQNVGKSIKADITDQKIYTLSDGTKSILSRINQPIKIKLYYASTAAMKGPDQIKFFNNYYTFVKELLEEYEAGAKGMVDLSVIDPRPFSDDETEALRHGLRRFPITEEENFFFGLVVQTPFGVEKTIPFFSPDRQNFVEYDISYLIDTAITRQKRKVGVLSSLKVMGDDVTGYMAQMMRMQGQQPEPAWGIIDHIRQKYEVTSVPADVSEIKDIDILMIIHPKDLSDKTLFAIDQFVLNGGRTIVCVDPYCLADQPDRQQMQMGVPPNPSSNLNILLRKWGLEVPANTFAGDNVLAQPVTASQRGGMQKYIGFLQLQAQKGSFNQDSVITADLNNVSVMFPGVINEVETDKDDNVTRTPIISTTSRGNSWTIDNAFELMRLNPAALMAKFSEGTEPVAMGYEVIGKFRSAFPGGIEIDAPTEVTKDGEEAEPKKIKLTGLTKAKEECAVMVFSDVDFISDDFAFQITFLGRTAVGDNSSLIVNSIDKLTGSTDLISIRSRGNFARPFTVVDEIEAKAEEETAKKIADINASIEGFQQELQRIASQAQQGQDELMGSSILEKKREVELKIREQQKELNEVKKSRRVEIEALGRKLRNFSMLLTPTIILVIAVVLGIYRSVRKRHYVQGKAG